MKKKLFLNFVFLFSLSCIFADSNIQKKITNTFINIDNVSIKRLLQAEKDDSSMEDFYYQQDIWKAENNLEKAMVANRIKAGSLDGTWKLYNKKAKSYYSDDKGYYIGRTINFTNINGLCNYQHQGSNSYVYKVDKDKYIVFPTMDAGIIRLLYFVNNELYIYNLDGDTWYLDDIHKTGNYYKKQ